MRIHLLVYCIIKVCTFARTAPFFFNVQFTSSWPRPAPAKLRAMYEELRAMKMNKKQGARRKYFWEKFYLPNHFFY